MCYLCREVSQTTFYACGHSATQTEHIPCLLFWHDKSKKVSLRNRYRPYKLCGECRVSSDRIKRRHKRLEAKKKEAAGAPLAEENGGAGAAPAPVPAPAPTPDAGAGAMGNNPQGQQNNDDANAGGGAAQGGDNNGNAGGAASQQGNNQGDRPPVNRTTAPEKETTPGIDGGEMGPGGWPL